MFSDRVTLPTDTDGSKSIAHVYSCPQQDANACLIAAAPEMLDALQLCIDDAEQQIKADAPGIAPDWYEAALAAVRKAEGRQS